MSSLLRPASDPSQAWLALKHAQALFSSTPDALDAVQQARLRKVISHQRQIETAILSSPEAAGVTGSDEAVQRMLDEIATRFESEDEFQDSLARQGLTVESLAPLLAREARVEAVLTTACASGAPVSDTDVELFYHLHASRFEQPERRILSHLLITISEDRADATPASVSRRMGRLRAEIRRNPERFLEFAQRYSECPSAMNDARIGPITRGQLFPALDACAFRMEIGEVSHALHSPLGLHLLRCEEILPAGPVALEEVAERIRTQMQDVRERNAQRAWINHLLSHRQAA